MTADNASSNAVQVAALFGFENSFDESNHVRCFNHTIQLAGKVLIKPFNVGMGKAEDSDYGASDAPSLEMFDEDDDIDNDGDASLAGDSDVEDDDDEILSDEEELSIMADTSEVRETVSKVRFLSVLSDVANLFLGASTTFLRDYSFDYHCPPGMATILRGP